MTESVSSVQRQESNVDVNDPVPVIQNQEQDDDVTIQSYIDKKLDNLDVPVSAQKAEYSDQQNFQTAQVLSRVASGVPMKTTGLLAEEVTDVKLSTKFVRKTSPGGGSRPQT